MNIIFDGILLAFGVCSGIALFGIIVGLILMVMFRE